MNPLAFNFYVCPENVTLEEFAGFAARAGAAAVGLTVRAVKERELPAIRRLLADHGLKVSSLNSAGYFLYGDERKRAEQDELNRRLIAAAGELQAETLVVITGGVAHGAAPLERARSAVESGVSRLAQQAARAGVRLGLEPIHPLGVLQKGCVNTLAQAVALARRNAGLGLTVDFFHSWWDPDFAGVFSGSLDVVRLVQICNVVTLDDAERFHREDLGSGLMDIRKALADIATKGYRGYFEFEMFPEQLRGRSAAAVISAVGKQYATLTSP